MPPAPGSLAQLPFIERPLLALLHLDDAGRTTIDTDYVGFGWARASRLWLDDGRGPQRLVEHALVLALHAADDVPALADDVLLEFAFDDDVAMTAHASRFLAVWLQRLPHDGPVVLAMCNPHRARLTLGPRTTFYADGPVDAWLDPNSDDPHGAIRLRANAWHVGPTGGIG